MTAVYYNDDYITIDSKLYDKMGSYVSSWSQ